MTNKIFKMTMVLFLLLVSLLVSLKLYNSYFSDNDDYVEETMISDLDIQNTKTDYEALQIQYNNNDIYATLSIPNLINTLVVKGDDNDYYLTHNINKEKSKLGAVFADYRTTSDSKQINIYGHNSNKHEAPFKVLMKYLDEEYIKNNDIVYLENEVGLAKYQIYSVRVTKSAEHINLDYQNDTLWQKHLELMDKNTIYKNGEVNVKDQIIVIQTCILNHTGNYLLINAKKIS